MIWRITLFLSSYIPLYCLLVVKYFADAFCGRSCCGLTQLGNVVSLALVVLAVASWCIFCNLLKGAAGKANENADKIIDVTRYKVEEIRDDAVGSVLNYLAVYFMPCLGMSLSSLSDCLVMLVVMATVGVIYVRGRVTFLNPMLLIKGFRLANAIVREVDVNCRGEERESNILMHEVLVYSDPDGLFVGFTYSGEVQRDFIVLAASGR